MKYRIKHNLDDNESRVCRYHIKKNMGCNRSKALPVSQNMNYSDF